MSQIASFYLIKNNQRQELSDGNCSADVYMAIWDYCESELDIDVRFPAPQIEETLGLCSDGGKTGVRFVGSSEGSESPEAGC